jgi:LytS/YehU family sensor histidine kinase
LSKEIAFIEQYIAIEKIRFGTDARIKYNFTNTTKEATLIAPFLLITLVENAFKHGFYTNSKEAFVHINISNTTTELIAIVENSLIAKQHFQESKREGKGLKNLKQRLQLLYPKSASIETVANAKTYTAVLKIMMD